eukprot:g10827.t1 g10827   contig4:2643876-2645031(+)
MSMLMEHIGKHAMEVKDKAAGIISETLGLTQNVLVTGKIFLTGAKGVIGYRTALRLLNSGYPYIRIGSRRPDDSVAQELSKKGAEIADFNWSDTSTYASALEGVKIVFASLPYVDNWAKNFPAFLHACEKSGVQYFVKVSFFHSRRTDELYQNVPLIELHGQCDKLLASSKIPYTILSASHFMSNALVAHHGESHDDSKPLVLYGSSHSKNVNYVSPNDVAEVAARVLLYSKPHMFKEYTLTGLQPISDDDVASAISKHTKRPVFYEDLPIDMLEEKEHRG